MREAQKKQAEEFVKSLSQANKEIKNAIEHKGQAELALDLLEQCQEGAISLGNMIEQIEGEDTTAVRLLEDYCELLYQYHEKIRQGLSFQAKKEYQILQNTISEIENSIRKDIAVRKEIVFLPYKASMWDSLESVWKAADADPNCDAYVIPIPYYDKNPDNTFGEMHYEGSLYPKDVPVVWYGNYDFEQRRPDAIFVHNPYDECNYMTSIHPDFYSSKLVQYTEKLVYIPYFVANEIDPENKNVAKDFEHFVLIPVVLNAHKTVVQSEAMRQVYIDILSDAAGEHSRKIWEEKILGLGSPKVDKVLNTSIEDLEIPEEWLKIIRKADGSWKKIILYNITINSLFRNKEKLFEGMRMVFKTFKENREELALLWRPHPLMKAAFFSMCPHLWAAYEKMLHEYRDEGWGIYDDTADLDRAIILCDAYYGYPSSIVRLCSEAGKPVMYRNLQENRTLQDFLQLVENGGTKKRSTNTNAGYEIFKACINPSSS